MVDYSSGSETYSNSANTGGTENGHVERIWAQQRISWLLQQVRLEGDSSELREQIVSLGIQYGLVVEGYTGMILVTGELLVDEEEGTLCCETSFNGGSATYPVPTATHPTADGAPAAQMLSGLGIVPALVVACGVAVFIYLYRDMKRKTS